MTLRKTFAFSLLALAAAAAVADNGHRPDRADHPFGQSQPIAGQYIVVFKDDVTDAPGLALQKAHQHGSEARHRYSHAIKGFSARLSPAAVAALRADPDVAYVEEDSTVTLQETLISPALLQSGPPSWGLDRIDQAALPLGSSYGYQYRGAGVYAFVIDTGILAGHGDFGGRVAAGYSAIADGNGSSDCNGHGTHVAGTLGGASYGVAKGVTLVPVRVLDCAGSGSTSGVIAGLDWVASQTAMRPAVANLSLGGSVSSTLNSSVANAVAKGVTVVVAAGNSNADACNYSPASAPAAITVGATGSSDSRSSYSNYGSCVDLFAPGDAITSAWYSSNSATNTISGTSMATPHVAGAAALALAANPAATPAAVTDFLLSKASAGKVLNAGTGSPNRLLYTLGSGAPAAAQTVAVSAIAGKGAKSGSKWTASATVTIKAWDGSALAAVVPGATVSGSFAPGGSASCVTGSNGSCTLKSAAISTAYTTTQFSVGSVSGNQLSYDATRNAVSRINIARP